MARLNESTTPNEPIEILKRRFVRQNREIARVNSIQSLRIRSLESEVSHLLSENVSLREQVIALNQEIERFEAAKLLNNGVYDIKEKLDTKLAELNNLISDLGALPRKFNKAHSENIIATNRREPRQPSLNPRHSTTDFESSAIFEDGKLPVIQEDKHYPRKTLESQELEELIGSDAGIPISPEAEDISINQPGLENDDLELEVHGDVANIQALGGDASLDEPFLPPTLETRKKKKYNSSPVSELFELTPGALLSRNDSGSTIKSGSKRKFSIENDDVFESIQGDDDDFQFSRPSHPPQTIHEHFVSSPVNHSPVEWQLQSEESTRDRGQSQRIPLEPKSTNSFITCSESTKAIPIHSQDKKAPPRVDAEHDENQALCQILPRERTYQKQRISNAKSSHNHIKRTKREDEHNDLAKPESPEEKPIASCVSTSQVHNKPSASTEMFNAPPRPSRRQRAVVSYAEPNLRDKMRRPTQEFIAAVGGDQSRRASGSQPGPTNASDESEGGKDCRVGLSTSQPSDATCDSLDSSSTQQMSMVSQRRRKTSPGNKEEQPNHKESVAETDINSCQAGWAAVDREPEVQMEDARTYKMQSRALKPGCKTTEHSNNMLKAAAGLTRQTRRHSSNPRSCGQEPLSRHDVVVSSIYSQDTSPQSSPKATLSAPASASTIPHQSTANAHAPKDSDDQSATSSAMESRQIRRGQRAAARRRSMML